MREVRLKAMAKINLGLDVVRKREDGYHEVRMIMQTIRMYDQIRLRAVSEAGIKVRTNLSYLPCNEDNLVHKAAKLLMEEFEVREGLSIELKKYIPVAAGMAGGSSDAAAVMVGVNRMFGLGLTKAQLMERGVKIGADVPYCIMRGTVLAEGIGEILTPLPPMPKCHVLIAKPGIHVSTKFVYGGLHLDEVTVHPDIDGQAAAIKAGDLNEAARLMGNVLESVTVSTYPVIDEIKEFMVQHGALGAMMSGSGPTVFGLFEDERTAKRAYEKLRRGKLAKQVFLTSIFNIGGNTNER
ncbi:4-(cytidine 5'-diphospho)-2-C-methyl-D-erythritol kinase [Murimonas intestini]|uniref:4-diphosphocytidyl-2-C-methyl-D-erythritol kinase n=1 Tax=Murimonas intestini TaxID=1337051 RepID=A0AB73T3G6_9FIRM|nr:4-(cytidine 5'-diphospho)-2-C-methyl-D-erythritol kinase [Murimonas intestini]MCR1841103.1 4-(cytidine 5'-diphospho)-2-C-methyl-D-erythritol kinase [Murimonas intestini]MCR1865779.1 4-(cytidine 5'-diphospho)-2-C-methyl-D-erythritol kinase [Murimonas intestini]MCR1883199.1 4-(cytidine 5'-diphospho)-2-C-methyl-D-erythritol kinase [Murimonas intestini]